MALDEQLFEQLSKLCGSGTVIVGIGNTLKGDDAAGPSVCKLLAGQVNVPVIDTGTVPENYIGPIIEKKPRTLLIIDAIDFAAPLGRIRIFKPEQLDSLSTSTHTLSPRLFIDAICQNISVAVYIVGIQPAHTSLGQPLSPEVTQAVETLALVLTRLFAPRD